MLAITEKKEEIISLLSREQVLIVCAETGCGKTTQLPQFCLQAGFAKHAKIALTQPRRIAAVSIAHRIAQELNTQTGALVGYEVRFSKKTSVNTKILCMTDGILLAQLSQNPKLLGYSVIIIDEAHERSLNIDLLLGYLRKILPSRPDLKVIISSATIDTTLFSKAFNDAPIINVSGRTFDVKIIYDEDELSTGYVERALDAVEKIAQIDDDGDILVFMPTQSDVLQTCRKLSGRFLRKDAEVLPLFSRLTFAAQNKIFERTRKRKIIVSTNIAETSITLEGIKFVVDTGLVRIDKYAPNLRVNRLPIEEASKAEVIQRSGRCGRVRDGVCVRLYSKKNFDSRDDFRTPQIQRSNLAGVILQMLNLNLGNIKEFAFIQPPQDARIDDALEQLYELGAIDNRKHEKNAKISLTQTGIIMSKFALEPHVSRMLIQARREGVSQEVAIIAAGLSIVEPRERPVQNGELADNAHQKFIDIHSDFITLLKIWSFFHKSRDELVKSHRKMRDYCEKHFLSFVRMREWSDIYEQISQTCREYDRNFDINTVDFENLSEEKRLSIHKSICSGLIGNVAVFDKEKNAYLATKGRICHIFPGSSLAGGKKRKAQWIMAQSISETSRVFARTVGPLDPIWIEEFVPNLLKKKYSSPFYDEKSGRVLCEETAFFYGLEIYNRKNRFYGDINPKEAREIFIQSALVENRTTTKFVFLEKNVSLCEKLRDVEIKRRVVGEILSYDALFEFYDARLPQDISSDKRLNDWICRENAVNTNDLLTLCESEIAAKTFLSAADEYPDYYRIGNIRLSLSYSRNFGREDDGITVEVCQNELKFIRDDIFDWLIPALLTQKIGEIIRTFEKQVRKEFIPIEKSANIIFDEMKRNYPELDNIKDKVFEPPRDDFKQALCKCIYNLFSKRCEISDDNINSIADFLKMRISVVSKDGKSVGFTKNLRKDRELLMKNIKDNDNTGTLGSLLEQKTIKHYENVVKNYAEHIKTIDLDGKIIPDGENDFGFPALYEYRDGVDVVWFASPQSAAQKNPFGLAKLLEFSLSEDFVWLEKNLRLHNNAKLLAKAYGGELVSKRLFEIIRDAVCFPITGVENWREFDAIRNVRIGILRKSEKSAVDNFVRFANSVSHVQQYLDTNIANLPKSVILRDIKNEFDIYIEQFVSGYCPLLIFERYSFYIAAFVCKIDKGLNSPKHYEECDKTIADYHRKSVEYVAKIHEMPIEFEIFVERFCFLVEELSLKLFAEPKIKAIENISVKKLEKFLLDSKQTGGNC